jgi:hypothetical protein
VFDAKTAAKIGIADRVGTLADALSAAASNRQARLSAGTNWLSTSARDRESARMRHELAMVGADVDSPGRPPAKPKRRGRADDPDDGDRGCDCAPCNNDDCDGCDCNDCACVGCDCETATAAAKKRATEFSRMRHPLAIAGA